MQIQDSSTSTINDDRRRVAHDARRFALAVGNNQADAFAELFQVIATSKVGPDKAKPAIAGDGANQTAAAASKPAERAQDAAEQSDEDTPDEALDNSVVQSLGQLAAVVAPQPSDNQQPVAEPELSADAPANAVDACCVKPPQSDAAAPQQGTELDKDVQALQPVDESNGETIQGKGKRERKGADVDQVAANQRQQNREVVDKPADDSSNNPHDHTGTVAKESKETSQAQAAISHAAQVDSTSAGTHDDRRRDRGEILRDRLTGDDTKSQDPVAPSASATPESSGNIDIDPNLAVTPTVAPEIVPPAPMVDAGNVVAAVAASVAVSSVNTATATSAVGASSETSPAVTGVARNSSTGSLDDPGSVSTMEQTPKSRQSEIADRARLIHRISKAFQKLGIDGGQVRLKMHPEDLGTVQLDMKISGNKVNASVTADNDAAARMLQEHLPELRQRLESQGLTVDRLQVEQRTDSGSSSFNNQQSFQQQNEAFQEAARRQSQRSNFLTGTPSRASIASVSGNQQAATTTTASVRYDGRLDINF